MMSKPLLKKACLFDYIIFGGGWGDGKTLRCGQDGWIVCIHVEMAVSSVVRL